MIALRYVRDASLFAVCYIALDWASYIDPVGPFNITPWNPQPALAIAWMMLGGMSHAPAVLATIVGADLLVRHAPGGYLVTFATAAVLTAGYGAMAWSLKRVLPAADLRTAPELALFSVIVIAGSGMVALAFIGLLNAFSVLPDDVFRPAAFRFWIGDAVGVLVTAPLLLSASNARHRAALKKLAGTAEAWAQAAVLGVTTWLIFNGLEGDPAHHFYLLFLPLIWIATRSGMTGAIIGTAIVQVGVVLGLHGERDIALPVLELQALVAALTFTSLFLGITVDERNRAESKLRVSLRLAAAGEMAGAIAHEVNQPLTALANYGETARLLLSQPAVNNAELKDLIDQLLSEGNRAADVVRRLRDFFRTGATRLERVEPKDLANAARHMAAAATGERSIDVKISVSPRLPALLIDRLQIELIIRNLLANAVDSLSSHPVEHPQITLAFERQGAERIRIAVSDNGPGMPASVRETLFEPFTTAKSRGMGLGLAVSRAIAEAHGGTLEAMQSPHAEFRLILPCAPTA